MKRKEFIKAASFAAATVATAGIVSCSTDSRGLKPGEIQHTVMFKLASGKQSAETSKFLSDAKRILSAISTVQNFQVYKQVSKKTDFDFYFSMIFADQKAYDTYNEHPDHVAFVENRWMKEVTHFQEADFVAE